MTLVDNKTYATLPSTSHTGNPSTPKITTPTTTHSNSIASDGKSANAESANTTTQRNNDDQILLGGRYNPHGYPRTIHQLHHHPGYLLMLGPTNRAHLGLSAPPKVLEQEKKEAFMMRQALKETHQATNAGHPINTDDLEAAN